MSHPEWVRGLKLSLIGSTSNLIWSHPEWVRGLKQIKQQQQLVELQSHPEWVRGLKLAGNDPTNPLPSGRTPSGCVD